MAAADVQLAPGPPTHFPRCFNTFISYPIRTSSSSAAAPAACAQSVRPPPPTVPASVAAPAPQSAASESSDVPPAPATPSKAAAAANAAEITAADATSNDISDVSDWRVPANALDLDDYLNEDLAELEMALEQDDFSLTQLDDLPATLGAHGSGNNSGNTGRTSADAQGSTPQQSASPPSAAGAAVAADTAHALAHAGPAAGSEPEEYVVVRLDAQGHILRQATEEDMALLAQLLNKQSDEAEPTPEPEPAPALARKAALARTPRGTGGPMRRTSNGTGTRKPGGPCCHCGASGVQLTCISYYTACSIARVGMHHLFACTRRLRPRRMHSVEWVVLLQDQIDVGKVCI